MKEPPLHSFAFLERGHWYVRYCDGEVSGLMPRRNAEQYAMIFEATCHKHSQAPKWWEFWK